MQLNERRFERMHFGKENAIKQPYSLPSEEPLTAPDSIRDLRVTVDNNLSWKAHINIAWRTDSYTLGISQSREHDVIISLSFPLAPPWKLYRLYNVDNIPQSITQMTLTLNSEFIQSWGHMPFTPLTIQVYKAILLHSPCSIPKTNRRK